MPRRRTLLFACLLPLALAGCSSAQEAPPEPSSAVRTSLPDAAPAASGEPTPSSLGTSSPSPGTVVQAAGPFDDRFRLSGLRLADGSVSGTITVTSDVSDLLELQVVAGFHDASGALVGTGRWTHHLDESHPHDEASTGPSATPNETEQFSIAVPAALRGRVVSASVAVPVLVNE